LDDHDSALDERDSNGTVAQHGGMGWDGMMRRIVCLGLRERACVCWIGLMMRMSRLNEDEAQTERHDTQRAKSERERGNSETDA
jgi:hypothetical protein